MRTCVTAGSLCNILDQAYLCTAIMRSHWSCLYMILLCNAYVTAICNVSVRSTVLHAYLNPFVRMGTMSPEDTIRDHIFKYWHASFSTSLLEFGYINYGLMLSLFFIQYVKTPKLKINLYLPTGLLEKKSILLEDTRIGYSRPPIFSKNLKLL